MTHPTWKPLFPHLFSTITYYSDIYRQNAFIKVLRVDFHIAKKNVTWRGGSTQEIVLYLLLSKFVSLAAFFFNTLKGLNMNNQKLYNKDICTQNRNSCILPSLLQA